MTDQPIVTKEEWIAALRSGEYKQIRGGLITSQGYCCLGVYLSEANKKNNDSYNIIDDVSKLHPDITVEKCIKMNDREFKTFAEIADYLESLP